jgi:hypothetical protein
MKRLSARALILAALLALPLQAASASSITPISKLDWEQNQRLEFRWRDDAVPPTWMRSAVLAAASDSNASRDAKAAVLAYDGAGNSWFAYTADIADPAALAYASRRVPDLFRIWLRPQGYVEACEPARSSVDKVFGKRRPLPCSSAPAPRPDSRSRSWRPA